MSNEQIIGVIVICAILALYTTLSAYMIFGDGPTLSEILNADDD